MSMLGCRQHIWFGIKTSAGQWLGSCVLSGLLTCRRRIFAANFSLSLMLRVTKIFRFETAHAIYGYQGSCRNIHGHSYVLHVTVQPAAGTDGYIAAPGFVIDFKDLKRIVNDAVVDRFDHCIILSKTYLAAHPELASLENMEIWEVEPTAENILLYVKDKLVASLPQDVKLHQLKLYETADSYAEWDA